MRQPLLAVGLLVALALGGCAKSQDSTRTLTERQRDSVLSRSSLPGASTVGRAQGASDGAARRAASMNAQVDSLPH
jgi:hypothetical protein